MEDKYNVFALELNWSANELLSKTARFRPDKKKGVIKYEYFLCVFPKAIGGAQQQGQQAIRQGQQLAGQGQAAVGGAVGQGQAALGGIQSEFSIPIILLFM